MTNIELPRDAAGREIPLDTEVLYDKNGQEIEVSCYQYYQKVIGHWNIKSVLNKYYRQNEVYITKPDSWEKLLDDLDNAAKGGDNAECCYMRRECFEVSEQCPGCRLYEQGKDKFNECSYLAYADIASRIRKLRSEGE